MVKRPPQWGIHRGKINVKYWEILISWKLYHRLRQLEFRRGWLVNKQLRKQTIFLQYFYLHIVRIIMEQSMEWNSQFYLILLISLIIWLDKQEFYVVVIPKKKKKIECPPKLSVKSETCLTLCVTFHTEGNFLNLHLKEKLYRAVYHHPYYSSFWF